MKTLKKKFSIYQSSQKVRAGLDYKALQGFFLKTLLLVVRRCCQADSLVGILLRRQRLCAVHALSVPRCRCMK